MRIIITGGGIGGLAAAVSLEQMGFDDITLLEQAPEFSEIGAGIQVSNNGARLLRHLGLEDAIRETACVSRGNYYYDIEQGDLILETIAGEWGERRYGAPFFHIRRTALLDVLHRGARTTEFHLDSRVTDVVERPTGVTVTTDSGKRYDGDVLIAADGIHSLVRTKLLGQQDADASGYLCWRALIPAERLHGIDVPHSCTAWWGPERSGVVFWVDGGQTMNFIGTVPSTEIRAESWETHGDVADLRASYAGACEPLASIVDAIDEPFLTGIFTRPIPERWHTNRMVLLGDSCHPIWPFLANGATQALEDGYVLARCLAQVQDGDPAPALAEYQARREPRVRDVARVSREMASTYHLADPAAVAARNQSMRARAETDPHGEWLRGWLWGYDVVGQAELPLDQVEHLPAPDLARPAGSVHA
jgi:salicylate hydroxylase